MGFKLFDEIGNEEFTNGEAATNVAPLDTVEMMDTTAAFESIAVLASEAEMARETIALSESVVASMESQVVCEKELMAKPESVSGATVVLSMESLNATAVILGADLPAKLSSESIEASPVDSLEIAIEEKQSLIARVIVTIKAMYKKFVAILKKMYVKAAVAMNGTAKQAEALKAKISEMKDGKDIEVDEKLLKLINAKLGGAMTKLGAKEFDSKFVKDLMDRIKAGRSADAISGTISAMAGKIDKAMSAAKDETSGKEVNDMIKELIPVGGIITRYDGTGIKSIVANAPEVKDDAKLNKQEVVNAIAKITFTNKTAEASKVVVKTIKWNEIAAIVGYTIPFAKDIKGFSDAVNKSVEAAEKAVVGLKEGEDDKKYLPVTKLANVVIANAGMDMVLGYMATIKGVLSVVAAATKSGSSDKKEEKKEDKKEEK